MLNSSTNTLTMPPISVFYKCLNLVYTKDYQSLSPNSPILVGTVSLPRDPDFPVIPMYQHKTYIQVLTYILTSNSSTSYPAKDLPQPSPLLMLPPATYLAIPSDQILHHSNSSMHSFRFPDTMAKGSPSSRFTKVENFPYHQTSCSSSLITNLLLIPLEVVPLQSMEKYTFPTKPETTWSAFSSFPVDTAMNSGVSVINIPYGSSTASSIGALVQLLLLPGTSTRTSTTLFHSQTFSSEDTTFTS